MPKRKNNTPLKRQDRIWKKLLDDSVRIRVLKAFLPILALFLNGQIAHGLVAFERRQRHLR